MVEGLEMRKRTMAVQVKFAVAAIKELAPGGIGRGHT
jgi:hypothetical protein